jgi:phosphatidylserine/phosphatidylglycerophosphate/cardiolipin synthase-like enzyme
VSGIDGRTLWRAWKLVREAGLDLFEPGINERLTRVPGWSTLRLPVAEQPGTPRVSVLNALRALSISEAERAASAEQARLVATLPPSLAGVPTTRDVVRTLIAGARHELLVLGFAISEDDFRELLIQRGMAGIQVTVVGDRLDGGARHLRTHWPALARPLVALEDVEPVTGRRRMHAKVIVADRREVLIGSANYTFSGMNSNFEFGVLVEGEVARQICRTVEDMQHQGWLHEA